MQNKGIQRLKSMRFNFMNKLYELAGANEYAVLDSRRVLADLGIHREEGEAMLQYLRGEGLIQFFGVPGPVIGITHRGVTQVEQALSAPDRESEYFPPVNIISIGQMTNSQVQQASPNAVQLPGFNMSRANELMEAVNELSAQATELGFAPAELSQLQSELATLRAQLSSPKPRAHAIAETVQVVRDILTGAVGSLAATLLAKWTGLLL